ncbi:MAG: hypothetical protein ACTII7_07445 [Galactobacter sp.]
MREHPTGPTRRARALVVAVGSVATVAGLAVAVVASAAQRPDGGSNGQRDPRPTQATVRPSDTNVEARAAAATQDSTPSRAAAGRATPDAASTSSATASPTAAANTRPAGTKPSEATASLLGRERAEDLVSDGLSVALDEPQSAKELRAEVKDVAVDDYLEELETQWQELDAYGWEIEGSPRVLSSEVTTRSEKERTAVITACIDSSAVRLLDADRKAINARADRSGPGIQIFTVQQGDDARWRIVDRSFPADPACGTDAKNRKKP